MLLKDPLGRYIAWSSKRWHGHVVANRTFLAPYEWVGTQTVEYADVVAESHRVPERLCYYKWNIYPLDTACYFKVIIDFRLDPDEGRLVTAYAVPTIEPGERVIWERQ